MPKGPPEGVSNFSDDHKILSFIVRVWVDESDMEKSEKVSRGHITLIPSGERQYFANINQIPALITSHLSKSR